MRGVISTRLMRWKKEWKSLLCWLLLPIVLTVCIMQSVEVWQEETKVPIGLVVEEQTVMATRLVEDIGKTQSLSIQFLDLEEALHKLEQHELDSVFVIREGYEENMLSGRRNQLIGAYSSNRSFAYQAVAETIASFAQQDAARSKAAFVIKNLFKERYMEDEWSYMEVIESSRERQQNEALLQSRFSYSDKDRREGEQSLPILQVWGIWALFALITTFFLFDWVLKENRQTMQLRWLFAALSFKSYAIGTLILYTALLVSSDLLAALIFSVLFQETVSLPVVMALIAFRLTINFLAFLLAGVYKQLFLYYVSGVAFALFLVVIGGAIVPLEGLMRKWPWIEMLSPVNALLTGTISYAWLFALIIALALWVWKGGKLHA